MIELTNLRDATKEELQEAKAGLEKQRNRDYIRPWELTIIEMYIDDITNELNRRAKKLKKL